LNTDVTHKTAIIFANKTHVRKSEKYFRRGSESGEIKDT
jgi:hypothetical protein